MSLTDTRTRHPAAFSAPVMQRLRAVLTRERQRLREAEGTERPVWVLDPFAGIGRIHTLHRPGSVHTYGIEIEPEWANRHINTICGDALRLMAEGGNRHSFDLVITSPCYGNRMADHHEARDGSTRRSYRHDLGRMPTEGSSATMAWGQQYWAFHAEAYRLVAQVLKPGGLFVLNVSDFIKAGATVPATMWHAGACWGAGLVEAGRPLGVTTQRMRFGENHDARVSSEVILRFRRPADA